MIYKVTSRWEEGMMPRWGPDGTTHELSDSQVVEAIIEFGRAAIIVAEDGSRTLNFQNDYD
jgi:hypothetical protein